MVRVSFWGCGQRIEALVSAKQRALMSISSYDFASRRGQATDRLRRGGDGRSLWLCPAPTANDGVRAFRWVDTKSAPEVARVVRRVHHDDPLLRRPGAPPAGLKGWRTPPQEVAAPWIGRRRQPVFVGEGSYIYGEALDSNSDLSCCRVAPDCA